MKKAADAAFVVFGCKRQEIFGLAVICAEILLFA